MTRQNVGRTVGAFAVGVAVGLVLRDAAKQLRRRARAQQWHREFEETATYRENLPDSLERREPAPQQGQPRFGGTGALGVSPELARRRGR